MLSDNAMDTALKKTTKGRGGKQGNAYLSGFRWVYTT